MHSCSRETSQSVSHSASHPASQSVRHLIVATGQKCDQNTTLPPQLLGPAPGQLRPAHPASSACCVYHIQPDSPTFWRAGGRHLISRSGTVRAGWTGAAEDNQIQERERDHEKRRGRTKRRQNASPMPGGRIGASRNCKTGAGYVIGQGGWCGAQMRRRLIEEKSLEKEKRPAGGEGQRSSRKEEGDGRWEATIW